MKQLSPANQKLLELLYDAMREEIGLRVETETPIPFRNKLYAIRRAAEDPALACLAFLVPPISNQVWIVKAYAKDSGDSPPDETYPLVV